MAGGVQKSGSGFWIYVGLAVAAGLTLGGLIFSWIRPAQTGITPNVTSTRPAAQTTGAPTAQPSAVEPVPERRAKTKLTPPPQHDQTEARPSRSSNVPSKSQSQEPPMTEKPPVAVSPVLIPPTPIPVPHQAQTAAPAGSPTPTYAPGRRRAVQEADSEGVTTTSSGSDRADAAGPLVLRRAKSTAGDTDASEAPNPAAQVPSTPQLPPSGLPSVRPAYNGPSSGVATWTGKLDKDQTLTITGGTPSTGVLAGAGLPGVPVQLTIDQSNLGFAEMPNAANGYKRVALRSHGKHDKIILRWTVQ